MPTIAQIEDALIQALRDTDMFVVVESIGRSDPPEALAHPAAFVYFVSDTDAGDNNAPPLPVDEILYEILVQNKNVSSAEAAAMDTYTLIDAVRTLAEGKTLGLTGIQPFCCLSRALVGYENGVITYRLRLRTKLWRSAP